MPKTIIIALFGVFFWFKASAQIVPDTKTKGTLIVSVICTDGVVMAADSRTCWVYDSLGTKVIYAYADSLKKIFKIGNYQIGITGKSSLNKIYWREMIDTFNLTEKPISGIQETFYSFNKFLNNRYKLSDFEIFDSSRFMLVGYEKDIPVIAAIDGKKPMLKMTKLGNRIYSDSNYKPFFIGMLPQFMTSENVSTMLDGTFRDYANETKEIGVGGPNYIILVTKNNEIRELKTFNFNKYRTYKEFIKSSLDGRTKVEYLFPESKSILINTYKNYW